jgi:hypothetical protein
MRPGFRATPEEALLGAVIRTSQIPVAAWFSVANCPLLRVKLVALSVLVVPLNTLNVSGLVRLNVRVPAPSSITEVTRFKHPEAELSGTVTTLAPDWNRKEAVRSIIVVALSH